MTVDFLDPMNEAQGKREPLFTSNIKEQHCLALVF